jgi:hypothetical protein
MITPPMIWRASFKRELYNARRNVDRDPEELPEGYDIIPFILTECVLFDAAPATIKDLENLMLDDYLSIMEVVNPLFSKINL